MSTSFVEYRGQGFWSWDGYLDHVLALLAETIPDESGISRLSEVRSHWREQSSGAFAGWTEEQREAILKIVEAVTHRAGITPEAKASLQLLATFRRKIEGLNPNTVHLSGGAGCQGC